MKYEDDIESIMMQFKINLLEIMNEELPSSFKVPLRRKLIPEISIAEERLLKYAKEMSKNRR